jgi:hypothetical protein
MVLVSRNEFRKGLLWTVHWVETDKTQRHLGCRRNLLPTSDIQDFNGRTV